MNLLHLPIIVYPIIIGQIQDIGRDSRMVVTQRRELEVVIVGKSPLVAIAIDHSGGLGGSVVGDVGKIRTAAATAAFADRRKTSDWIVGLANHTIGRVTNEG